MHQIPHIKHIATPILKRTRTKSTPLRKVFSQQDLEYLTLHHKTTSTADLARALGFSVFLIYSKLRDYDMKPYRRAKKYQPRVYPNEKIAAVLEDYCMTYGPMDAIAYRHNVSLYNVTKWITWHLLPTKQNENTEILVLKSKV